MARTPQPSRTSPRNPPAPASDVDNWMDIVQKKELEAELVSTTDQSKWRSVAAGVD